MRKIVLGLAVSLDGYIEGPNGEYDWCFNDQDYGLTAFFQRMDAIFMGRKSYELSKSNGGQEHWKDVTTYVFSNSIKEINDKNVELVSGDIVEQVRKIRARRGKDIWLFGGAELTTAFVNEGLIDEYWLSIHPVLLGSGKLLFQKIRERKNLKLTDHKVYGTGLVSVCYEPT